MRWHEPWFLLAGLAWILWVIYYVKKGSSYRERVIIPSLGPLQKVSKGKNSLFKLHSPFALRALACLCLIIAAARPQLGVTKVVSDSEGLDIILGVDTSGSMRAMDFEIDDKARDRLYVVKRVISDFINQRVNDRIGIIVFGSEAFTQAPLTIDHGVLSRFLDAIDIGMAGENTAIGSAIAAGVKRLKDLDAESKVMILLTDGENTAGSIDPMQAAEVARTLGIKIYTIGVGGNKPVPFPRQSFFGTVYDKRVLKLDETLLKAIAEKTGAQYFRAEDTLELKKIYQTIDQLETRSVSIETFTNVKELGPVLMLFALGFLVLEFITRFLAWGRFA